MGVGAGAAADVGRASRGRIARIADRVAVGGLVLGLALYVMPFWAEGRLRWALWLTLVSTVLHVFTSHGRAGSPARIKSNGGGPS